jgi:hypothetical protein
MISHDRGYSELLDFVHHPEFEILENTTFRKLDLFPSSGPVIKVNPFEGTEQSRSLLPSPEDGNRSSCRKVLF